MSTISGAAGTAPLKRQARPVNGMLPWVLAVATILLLLLGASFLLPTMSTPNPNVWAFPGFATVGASAVMLLGLAIATRHPDNPIGWLFLVAALLGAVQGVAAYYAHYAVVVNGRVDDLAAIGRWVDNWIWIPLIQAVTTFLFVLFPDGRPASPRWRWVLWAATAAGVLGVIAIALDPNPLRPPEARSLNPVGVAARSELTGAMLGVALIGFAVTMLLGVGALLARLRGSSGVERKQLQWLLGAGVLISGAFILYNFGPSKDAEILVTVGFLAIPGAATVAILRYRLWDIDLIINRTLVYVPLTGLLAGLYTIAVAALQRAFLAITGEDSDAPIILSALVLASLFTPIKNRLQVLVDARFKGDADPTGRLVAFANEVRADYRLIDPNRLGRQMVDLVGAATGATAVRLEKLHAHPRSGKAVTFGHAPDEAAVVIVLEAPERAIGRLEVGPRASGRPYRPADVDAMEAAAAAVAEAVDDLAHTAAGGQLKASHPTRDDPPGYPRAE